MKRGFFISLYVVTMTYLRRTSCRVDVYLVRPRVNRLASAGPSYHPMFPNPACDTPLSCQAFHSSSNTNAYFLLELPLSPELEE